MGPHSSIDAAKRLTDALAEFRVAVESLRVESREDESSIEKREAQLVAPHYEVAGDAARALHRSGALEPIKTANPVDSGLRELRRTWRDGLKNLFHWR